MKKLFSTIMVLGLLAGVSACGDSDNKEETSKENEKKNNKSYQEKLEAVGFKENIKNQVYEYDYDNGDKVFIYIESEYIHYENNIDDTQIKYNYNEDSSDLQGCRYNYKTDSATEDGEGFGGCTEETVNFLKNDKLKIDELMKKAEIKYSELVNK